MKNTDYGFLLAPQYICLFVLMVVGAIAVAIVLTRIGNALTRKATGWNALTQRFPATDVHKFGGKYKKRNGIFGGSNKINSSFLVELAHEGLLITADFDRTPILVPWSAIIAIDELDVLGFTMMVNLTINNERKLIFDVPKDALKAIQENVPTERFHQTNFFELLKQNLLNRP